MRQVIDDTPYISAHPLGDVWGELVVFGTGRLLTAQDKASQAQQSLYGIRDAPARCGNLTLTDAGIQGSSSGDAAQCWR